MSRKLLSMGVAATLLGSAALADVPAVATDIAPVHSLAARVMDGIGTPALVVAQGASPHEYNLRPKDASALQGAELVFWIGEDLSPWLEGALDTLSGEAHVVELMALDGVHVLETREGALFEKHDHGHHEAHDHHDEHDEHEEPDEHKEHAHHEEHDHHEAHAHGHHDPHLWLSPENAVVWLGAIANALADADPDNATAYHANAALAVKELAALTSEINTALDPVRGKKFIVFHDAYQYFETAFDFPASGAISLSDASDPSPARIAEIRGRVAGEGITCVLSEPQFNPRMVATVTDGTAAKTAVLDPLGANIPLGPDFYPQLLRDLAHALKNCLG